MCFKNKPIVGYPLLSGAKGPETTNSAREEKMNAVDEEGMGDEMSRGTVYVKH